jgi:ABC-type antimicrobial peptide transport system ATPase subunit
MRLSTPWIVTLSILFILAAIVVFPLLAPQDPYRVQMGNRLQPISAMHWLGTDHLGRDLQDELGLAYLFISHDLAAVHFMSDRIMVMKDGSLLEHFSKEALFHSDRHSYTQSLLEVFSTCCLPTEPILL